LAESFFVFGFFLMIGSGVILGYIFHFRYRSILLNAKVVAYAIKEKKKRNQPSKVKIINWETAKEKRVTLFPVMEYSLAHQKFRSIGKTARFPPKYHIGQTIEIYCEESDPLNIMLKDNGFIGFIVLFLLMGLFSISIEVLFWGFSWLGLLISFSSLILVLGKLYFSIREKMSKENIHSFKEAMKQAKDKSIKERATWYHLGEDGVIGVPLKTD